MDKIDKKPDDELFINFMMHVLDFKEASVHQLRDLSHGTEVYIIRAIPSEQGYVGYRLDKCKFIEYHENMNAVELDDIKGNYMGHVPLDEKGNPCSSVSITGYANPLERIFLSYYEAMKYMHQIKYVCDVAEEDRILGILQGLKKNGIG